MLRRLFLKESKYTHLDNKLHFRALDLPFEEFIKKKDAVAYFRRFKIKFKKEFLKLDIDDLLKLSYIFNDFEYYKYAFLKSVIKRKEFKYDFFRKELKSYLEKNEKLLKNIFNNNTHNLKVINSLVFYLFGKNVATLEDYVKNHISFRRYNLEILKLKDETGKGVLYYCFKQDNYSYFTHIVKIYTIYIDQLILPEKYEHLKTFLLEKYPSEMEEIFLLTNNPNVYDFIIRFLYVFKDKHFSIKEIKELYDYFDSHFYNFKDDYNLFGQFSEIIANVKDMITFLKNVNFIYQYHRSLDKFYGVFYKFKNHSRKKELYKIVFDLIKTKNYKLLYALELFVSNIDDLDYILDNFAILEKRVENTNSNLIQNELYKYFELLKINKTITLKEFDDIFENYFSKRFYNVEEIKKILNYFNIDLETFGKYFYIPIGKSYEDLFVFFKSIKKLNYTLEKFYLRFNLMNDYNIFNTNYLFVNFMLDRYPEKKKYYLNLAKNYSNLNYFYDNYDYLKDTIINSNFFEEILNYFTQTEYIVFNFVKTKKELEKVNYKILTYKSKGPVVFESYLEYLDELKYLVNNFSDLEQLNDIFEKYNLKNYSRGFYRLLKYLKLSSFEELERFIQKNEFLERYTSSDFNGILKFLKNLGIGKENFDDILNYVSNRKFVNSIAYFVDYLDPKYGLKTIQFMEKLNLSYYKYSYFLKLLNEYDDEVKDIFLDFAMHNKKQIPFPMYSVIIEYIKFKKDIFNKLQKNKLNVAYDRLLKTVLKDYDFFINELFNAEKITHPIFFKALLFFDIFDDLKALAKKYNLNYESEIELWYKLNNILYNNYPEVDLSNKHIRFKFRSYNYKYDGDFAEKIIDTFINNLKRENITHIIEKYNYLKQVLKNKDKTIILKYFSRDDYDALVNNKLKYNTLLEKYFYYDLEKIRNNIIYEIFDENDHDAISFIFDFEYLFFKKLKDLGLDELADYYESDRDFNHFLERIKYFKQIYNVQINDDTLNIVFTKHKNLLSLFQGYFSGTCFKEIVSELDNKNFLFFNIFSKNKPIGSIFGVYDKIMNKDVFILTGLDISEELLQHYSEADQRRLISKIYSYLLDYLKENNLKVYFSLDFGNISNRSVFAEFIFKKISNAYIPTNIYKLHNHYNYILSKAFLPKKQK